MKNKSTCRLMVFAGLLLLFSCNERKGKTEASASTPTTHTVEITQMKFIPAELLVKKGDTVIWINRDMVDHNVTDAVGKQWASPNLAAGDSWRQVVNESMAYLCTLHPVMKGAVVLQ